MNIIEELAQAFKQTYDDKTLSKSERKALRSLLADANLDQRKRDILRSKVFDIAKTGISGGEAYFTLEWLEDATRLLESPAEAQSSGSSVYFSPGDEPLNAIITQIQGTRDLLEICVFTISDDRITNAILDRHRFNTPIRIITDNDKLNDAGSDIRALAESGVEVRVDNTPNHMHHKFAVFDSETVLTGSYNWTRSAATRNEENVLVTQEKGIITQYQREFKALWKRSDPF